MDWIYSEKISNNQKSRLKQFTNNCPKINQENVSNVKTQKDNQNSAYWIIAEQIFRFD